MKRTLTDGLPHPYDLTDDGLARELARLGAVHVDMSVKDGVEARTITTDAGRRVFMASRRVVELAKRGG